MSQLTRNLIFWIEAKFRFRIWKSLSKVALIQSDYTASAKGDNSSEMAKIGKDTTIKVVRTDHK